jgi:hypothetical protein
MLMQRKYVPAVFAAALMVLAVAACGSDSDQGSAPTATLPRPADTELDDPNASTDYTHPTGADEVVFSYAEVGGFVPRAYAFQTPPVILVSGDGRVFTQGAQIAIFPGPMLPAIQVQPISELGIQRLLAAADEAGLFAEIDYTAELNVADASTAMVTIEVDGDTWVHEAYALGIGVGPNQANTEAAQERQALLDFLAQIGDLAALVGPEQLGPLEIYEPDSYLIESLVVDDPLDFSNSEIEPTIVAWPAGATIPLAEAAACSMVSATEVGSVLEAANQLTLFSDDGVIYQVFAKQQLPGTTC